MRAHTVIAIGPVKAPEVARSVTERRGSRRPEHSPGKRIERRAGMIPWILPISLAAFSLVPIPTQAQQDQPQSLGDIARQQRDARKARERAACIAPCMRAFPAQELGNSVALALGPGGQLLALGAYGSDTLSIRDAGTGSELRRLSAPLHYLAAAAFSPDGKTLATGGTGKTVILWNVDDGSLVSSLDADPTLATSLAFSSDGRMLITGGRSGTIRLWEVSTGRALHELARPGTKLDPPDADAYPIYGVAFSHDGRLAAAGGMIDEVVVWDVATGRKLKSLKLQSSRFARTVWFSRDGSLLLSRNETWELPSGSPRKTQYELGDHTFLHPDGLWAAGAEHGNISVFELRTSHQVATLPADTSQVIALAPSPDGEFLASFGEDHTARIWDMSSFSRQLQEEAAEREKAAASDAASRDESRKADAGQDAALEARLAPIKKALSSFSPIEKRGALMATGLALKEMICKTNTGRLLSFDELLDKGCPLKPGASGFAPGPAKPDEDPRRDPDYSAQMHVAGTSYEVIATPRKPGPANFWSDGKNVYYNRKGPASKTSTLLGSLDSVFAALMSM